MRTLVSIAFILTVCHGVTVIQSPALASATGWDYNLTKKCIKSVDHKDPNYYQDISQCTGNHNWTIAIQSESELGRSCIGNNNHSFPINTTTSPLLLSWHPTLKTHPDDSPWTVTLTTDLLTKTHSCAGNNFNWYALMDHVGHGGGPLVAPNKIATSAKLKLSADMTNQAALRSFIAIQGFWNNISYGIELNYYLSPNWGDAHADPAIIQIARSDSYHFFALDGRAFGISQNIGEEGTIYVNWLDILNYLSDKQHITFPTNWVNSATGAIYIGTELNNFKPSGSGKSTLQISNFRSASTITPLSGDLNGDGLVNLADFNLLISKFGNPYTLAVFNNIIANFGR